MSPVPLFPLGMVVATPAALSTLLELGASPATLLARHVSGDWGDLDADDRSANEQALGNGVRIFSSYTINGTEVWIITEADRSSSCVLLPDDY